jgi:hypothetical protein
MTPLRRTRLGTKLLMKCHDCRQDCLPKDGDWHDSKDGQIFLCRTCESRKRLGKPEPRKSLLLPVAAARTAPAV